jgi:hypothetical protein
MIFRLWQFRVMGSIVALGTYVGSAASQEVANPSTALIVRNQLGSIAEEVTDKLQIAANSTVIVSVQANFVRELAENAFVKSLQNRGFRPFLKPMRDSAAVNLRITVLNDRAQFKETAQRTYERIVQTELEVRTERDNGESLAYLGIFHRVSSDTVSSKDMEVRGQRQGDVGDEDATLFQKVVGPLILLASGIIIVYLFFTVRS